MRGNLSSRILLILITAAVLTLQAKAQDDMVKPTPVKSALMEMLMGTWKAEPYDMMGSKWNESAKHYMMHNGQFMFIDINGSDDKGNTYTGTVVMSQDKDGNLKGWSFDDWGQSITYTGKTSGNKATVTGTNSYGTETREIEVNGNTMVHKLTWTMKDKDGKDMTMNQTITYHKE